MSTTTVKDALNGEVAEEEEVEANENELQNLVTLCIDFQFRYCKFLRKGLFHFYDLLRYIFRLKNFKIADFKMRYVFPIRGSMV